MVATYGHNLVNLASLGEVLLKSRRVGSLEVRREVTEVLGQLPVFGRRGVTETVVVPCVGSGNAGEENERAEAG